MSIIKEDDEVHKNEAVIIRRDDDSHFMTDDKILKTKFTEFREICNSTPSLPTTQSPYHYLQFSSSLIVSSFLEMYCGLKIDILLKRKRIFFLEWGYLIRYCFNISYSRNMDAMIYSCHTLRKNTGLTRQSWYKHSKQSLCTINNLHTTELNDNESIIIPETILMGIITLNGDTYSHIELKTFFFK